MKSTSTRLTWSGTEQVTNKHEVMTIVLIRTQFLAIVAIEPKDWNQFGDSVRRLVKSTFRYLLVTTEYNQANVHGPPYAIYEKDVAEIYDWASIKKLEEIRDADNQYIKDKFIEANEPLYQSVYLIEQK